MPRLAPETTQGPAWLAEAVFASGPVVRWSVGVLGLCAAAGVAWKLYHEGTPSAETQVQMGSILATAIATASATIAVAGHLEFGYLLDVVIGVVGGSGLVVIGQLAGERVLRRLVEPDRRPSAAWLSLGSLSWIPLAIVPPGPRTSLLFSLVSGGLVVALGMAVVTAPHEF
jgi:hypothetical protein